MKVVNESMLSMLSLSPHLKSEPNCVKLMADVIPVRCLFDF